MTADENAKKAQTDDAKSLKALKESKEQLKREKQSKSDDDEDIACDTLQSSSGFDMMMKDHEDWSSSQNENNNYQKDLMDNFSNNNNNNKNNNKHQSQPSNASAYPNQNKSMMSPSSNERKGSLRSLFEDDNRNNGEVRVSSKHVTNYNMMVQLSQNKGSSNSGGIGNGKAAVNMESTMLASGIQQSVRNLVSVVEKPISNSINANNADDRKSDDIYLQQIVSCCTHEQQRDNETMEALILCCKEFSTPEFLYIFYIYDVYIFFCCCYVYVFLFGNGK
ncbi:hypothetical protein RFI_37513 [Reticulomyxa filosa]|uniref:Uncharacterized protein n=1 Tax=Reticulomyxa filosa TaxID=46433 RepID=X6LGW5_RETFI|nr:hypothetical protein RFI_37513 [Reticulomyxa filosa]|eukprot:ETN99954.1 hypothetical protein RFI_37513 [Reticulomyxa filosa]